jgi:hypothetical protein
MEQDVLNDIAAEEAQEEAEAAQRVAWAGVFRACDVPISE